MSDPVSFFELSDGEVTLWREKGGPVCIKTRTPFNDPVELTDEEALELARLLTQLVGSSPT